MLSGKAIFADEDVYAGYKKRRHADELVREALTPLGVPAQVIDAADARARVRSEEAARRRSTSCRPSSPPRSSRRPRSSRSPPTARPSATPRRRADHADRRRSTPTSPTRRSRRRAERCRRATPPPRRSPRRVARHAAMPRRRRRRRRRRRPPTRTPQTCDAAASSSRRGCGRAGRRPARRAGCALADVPQPVGDRRVALRDGRATTSPISSARHGTKVRITLHRRARRAAASSTSRA